MTWQGRPLLLAGRLSNELDDLAGMEHFPGSSSAEWGEGPQPSSQMTTLDVARLAASFYEAHTGSEPLAPSRAGQAPRPCRCDPGRAAPQPSTVPVLCV